MGLGGDGGLLGLFGLWAFYLAIMDQGQVSVKRAYELEETFELV